MLQEPTRRPPPVPKDVKWPAPVKAWWRLVWKSAVASEWDPIVDLQAVTRLGSIYAALADGDVTASMHSQAARLESELLLTPKARRSAYVRLPNESDAEPRALFATKREPQAGDPRESLQPRAAVADPRDHLRDLQ